VTPEIQAKLDQFEITLMSEGVSFCFFARGDCLAIVPCQRGVFGAVGSSGLATDDGLQYLMWREGRPLLSRHGAETPAAPDQVERIQQFSADLKSALGQ
jgi:hypothetical protein